MIRDGIFCVFQSHCMFILLFIDSVLLFVQSSWIIELLMGCITWCIKLCFTLCLKFVSNWGYVLKNVFRFTFELSVMESSLLFAIPLDPNIIFTIFSRSSLKHPILSCRFQRILSFICLVHKRWQLEMHWKWLWWLPSPRHFQWCCLHLLSSVWCVKGKWSMRPSHCQNVTSWVLALLDGLSSLFELQPFACTYVRQYRNKAGVQI